MKMMKAVVVTKPKEFSVQSVPKPVVPPAGLLVKVLACGLCGSDLRTLRSGHRNIAFPWTIGHEICGIVEEKGPDCVGNWQIGQRLAIGPLAYCGECDFCRAGQYELCENQKELGQHWPGGLAEYVAIPAECVRYGNIQSVPEGMESMHAAVIEPISSCVNAQEKANVTLGDTVVIFGTGPIGCIHIALAKARGAFKVYVIDIDENRLKMAGAFEPDGAIDASTTNPVEAIRTLTGGKGADVVIVATPAPIATNQAIEMARKGGRVIQFGGMSAADSKPQIDMNLIHYRSLSVIGTSTFGQKHNITAMRLVESGAIPVKKLITHVFSLDDFVHGANMALEGKVLKGVFIP